MMGTMSLGSSIVISKKGAVTLLSNDKNYYPSFLSKKNTNCLMNCQSEGNVIKTNGVSVSVSSSFTKRSILVNVGPGTALLDAERSVLPPNGNVYNGAQNCIGIVNILKGKAFFVIGAIGFLGKEDTTHIV
ncbi:unnamed protein product [Lactuca saligna]|uniref:Uncharacterized protein n=1 Tax=Lactuca saligna TaxID=75948 RepID=A0AA36EEL6_LACSI|nr:unnamed protein product [Lactuca saligna]